MSYQNSRPSYKMQEYLFALQTIASVAAGAVLFFYPTALLIASITVFVLLARTKPETFGVVKVTVMVAFLLHTYQVDHFILGIFTIVLSVSLTTVLFDEFDRKKHPRAFARKFAR
jgi:hypothetical protein